MRQRLSSTLRQILPEELSDEIEQTVSEQVDEIRLHAERYAVVVTHLSHRHVRFIPSRDALSTILKRMCRDSIYAYEDGINQGYLTLEGGVRVGIVGHAATEHGKVIGVSRISSLILRIPHTPYMDIEVLLHSILSLPSGLGMLLYSPPGVGKTTTLRALATALSSPPYSKRCVVVDTREELRVGLSDKNADICILSGYPRKTGIEIALRSLNAEVILCDEIGCDDDANAILSAANCGVSIIATAHAARPNELLSRPSLAALHKAHVFGLYAALSKTARGEVLWHITPWERLFFSQKEVSCI